MTVTHVNVQHELMKYFVQNIAVERRNEIITFGVVHIRHDCICGSVTANGINFVQGRGYNGQRSNRLLW